jgi:hypothetical protein
MRGFELNGPSLLHPGAICDSKKVVAGAERGNSTRSREPVAPRAAKGRRTPPLLFEREFVHFERGFASVFEHTT